MDDEFLREKEDIRKKMLKYSRQIKEGRAVLIDTPKEPKNDLLKERLTRSKKTLFNELHIDELEAPSKEPKEFKKEKSIYLKEDLINVKLEERRSLSSKILAKFKKKAPKERELEKAKSLAKGFDSLPKKQDNKEEGLMQTRSFEPKKEVLTKINLKKEERLNISITPQQQVLKEVQKPLDNTSLKAKESLLDTYSEAMNEERNFNFNQLLFAILLIGFAIVIFVPQIYIRNNIYYLSREIATLRSQESVLSEENKELKKALENMRFQNQILDYLEWVMICSKT